MAAHEGFTPADVARRVAAMGVIVDPATVWSYLRTRFADRYPERADQLQPALLPVDEGDLEDWLDDFLDGVEASRARLVRRMNEQDPPTDD
jgi:hypothetical protein